MAHRLWLALACLLLASACSRPAAPKQLSFIEDDYARARAEAEQRNVPLFVDVWASWCHTCLSVKQYVFPDPALQPLADRYVWLAIDSERRDNAAFLQRFPSRSLPTLWVIEPGTQAPLLKWIGAATAPELKGVLEDTLRDRSQPAAPEGAEANALWLRGHRASAAGETARAIEHYRRALEVAPKDWARRPQTVEALSMRFAESDDARANVELAAREAPSMPPSTARLNVVLNAIDASEDLPQHEALPGLLKLGTSIAETQSDSVLLDDRSSLYLSLISAYKASNPDESKRLAGNLSRALDAQAARETDSARRRVWDPHRVEAYLAIGEPARAIPMLEQSERDAPKDYNAAARLARVYLTLQRLPEARAAIDRALPLSDGPRKLRLYMLKADILIAAEDKPGARAALEAALEFARSAQLPAQYDKLRQTIERRARELS